MPVTSSREELRAWLRLMLEPGLGPVQARSLLAAIGLPQDIYSASLGTLNKLLPTTMAQQLRREPSDDIQDQIERSLQWLDAPDRRILTLADPEYPKTLLDTWDPPLLLFAHGDISLLSRASLGIVGARSATPGGLENAHAFARHLATQGWCIVSGLAQGIDTAAHTGALDAGTESGSTIAVLGTGIDIVYPAANRDLAHRIARHGLLISEFPLGTRALRWQFPKRNRLVAGLCKGILVVEAARQSGSLITARMAGELGREVFAIPGSIHSPLSRGCHALIREGAKLVESGQDIHDELSRPMQGKLPLASQGNADRVDGAQPHTTRRKSAPHTPADGASSKDKPMQPAAARDTPASASAQPKYQTQFEQLSEDAKTVLQALGHDPAHPDTLQLRTGFPMATLTAALLELEMAQAVHRLEDGQYQRT